MQKQITLNGKTVRYDLQRKKVKNVNLRIKADGTVTVSAGVRVPVKIIENFLASKADLILKTLTKYEKRAENAVKPLRYESGEAVRVMGQEVTLKVVDGTKNGVEFDGEHITLTVKDTDDSELKRKTLDGWLASVCAETVGALCVAAYPVFEKHGVAYPRIRYRHMKSMWGNCRAESGILTFNYALVHVPTECIEYVVYHELTHFFVPNHSREFYAKLDSFLPDWRERKRLLDSVGIVR